MTSLNGVLKTGKHLLPTESCLHISSVGMVDIEHANYQCSFSKLIISPRIRSTTRFITFPNGSMFETLQNDEIDQLIERFGQSSHKQRSWRKSIIQLMLLVLVLAVTWLTVHYGTPNLSRTVADTIPVEVIIEEGQRAYTSMESVHFVNSQLDEDIIKQYQDRFKAIAPEHVNGFEYKLHIKHSETLGANAFAFPSGDIVVTDELIQLAEHEDEVVQVLLHEIGHVEERHAVRSLVQASTLLLIAVAVSGDMGSASTFLIGIPALMLNSNYSRRMESEADEYALKEIERLQLDPMHFANILQKLEASKQEEEGGERVGKGYFASHPHTKHRIERFKVLSSPTR